MFIYPICRERSKENIFPLLVYRVEKIRKLLLKNIGTIIPNPQTHLSPHFQYQILYTIAHKMFMIRAR